MRKGRQAATTNALETAPFMIRFAYLRERFKAIPWRTGTHSWLHTRAWGLELCSSPSSAAWSHAIPGKGFIWGTLPFCTCRAGIRQQLQVRKLYAASSGNPSQQWLK